MASGSENLASAEQRRHLEGGFAAGAARYGALPLPFEAFAEAVIAAVRRSLAEAGVAASEVRCTALLEAAHLEDLFLAIACQRQITGAWERLCAEYGPRLHGLALRRGTSHTLAEDLAQAVLSDLVQAPGEPGRTRLASYDGTGTLFAWLAVILVRKLSRQARGAPTSEARLNDQDDCLPDPRPATDPAETAATEDALLDFDRVLRAAWHELSDQERLVVLARHRDGLKLAQISVVLDVGVSRTSKILSAAVDKLRRHCAADLPETTQQTLLMAAGRLRDRLALHLEKNASAQPQPSRGRHVPTHGSEPRV